MIASFFKALSLFFWRFCPIPVESEDGGMRENGKGQLIGLLQLLCGPGACPRRGAATPLRYSRSISSEELKENKWRCPPVSAAGGKPPAHGHIAFFESKNTSSCRPRCLHRGIHGATYAAMSASRPTGTPSVALRRQLPRARGSQSGKSQFSVPIIPEEDSTIVHCKLRIAYPARLVRMHNPSPVPPGHSRQAVDFAPGPLLSH